VLSPFQRQQTDLSTRTIPSRIEDLRPAFHDIISKAQDNFIFALFTEVDETVWLRAIQRLKMADLGIADESKFIKFKALMIVLAHENFYRSAAWLEKYFTFYYSEWATILSTFCAQAYADLFFIKRNTSESEEAYRQRLDTILAARVNQAKQDSNNFNVLINKILDREINIDNNQELIAVIKNIIIDARIKGTLDLVFMEKKIFEVFSQIGFNRIINAGALRFDAESIKKKIEKIEGLNIAQACREHRLERITRTLFALHSEFLKINEEFMAIYNNISNQIQDYMPGFSINDFSISYNRAFSILTAEKNNYVVNFLLETYLQQWRKPQRMSTIHDTLTTYIFMANSHNEQHNIPVRFSDHLLSQGTAILIKEEGTPPPSLHEIVAQAYSILHAPLAILQKPELQAQLASWTRPRNIMPLLSRDDNSEEKPDAPLATASTTRERALIPYSNSSLNILSTISNPLFSAQMPPPGSLSPLETTILSHVSEYHFQPLFENLSKDPQWANNPQDRETAIQRFNQALNQTHSLEGITQLLLTAKPYINRHRHFLWDAFFKKHNTNSWKTAFKAARSKSLEILKKELNNRTTEEDKRHYLTTWRKNMLFSEHRNESILCGAFGRTRAQKSIDNLLKQKP